MAEELRRLTQAPPSDPNERRQLYEAARSLCQTLETPADAMHRIFWSGAQPPMAQTAVDLKLFRTLSQIPTESYTVDQLSTTANPALLSRVLRYLASFGLIDEISQSTYRANPTTEWLATVGGEGGIKHFDKTITPVFRALPDVLREQEYQNLTDPLKTAFQKAHKTTSHGYNWLPDDPTLLTAFFDFLKAQRQGEKKWTETFPVEEIRLSDSDVEDGRVLFVDVGGGTGPQCLAVRQTDLEGRIVLQDQPQVLARANEEELKENNIEVMAHDFFTEQPVKHAKAYYMKNIMHDWPDEKCISILQNLLPALAKDSVILFQDCVLPDIGASWKQTQIDIQMMAALAAIERTRSQWEALLQKAGLKIRDVYVHNEETGNSVIVAVPA